MISFQVRRKRQNSEIRERPGLSLGVAGWADEGSDFKRVERMARF